MKEANSNIAVVCQNHASRPNPKYKTVDPKLFIGRCVKRTFKGKLLGKERDEHMWVVVKCIEDGVLVGTLDNDPVCEMDVDYGDTVRVRLEEIEAVDPELPKIEEAKGTETLKLDDREQLAIDKELALLDWDGK